MKKFYLNLILLFFVISGYTQTICNGTFEASTYSDDWVLKTNGTAVAFSESTDTNGGTKALKAVVSTEHSFKNRIESCSFDLTNKYTYTISLYAKKTSTTVDPEIKMKLIGLGDVYIIPITSSSWTKYSVKFKCLRTGSNKLRLSFTDVDTYVVDDVVITNDTYKDCNNVYLGTAYKDNCDVCVDGDTDVTSTCTTINVGTPKTIRTKFYGYNAKNIGKGNILSDVNIVEAWKNTNATIYRYPGGTFANSFDWHTGTTIVGGRPPALSPTVTPEKFVKALPNDVDILWMANVRFPLPAAKIDWSTISTSSPINAYRDKQLDWRVLTRAQLLSDDVLTIKTNDILAALLAFKNAGQQIKYLELGNEFYFSDDEGLNGVNGAGGDNSNSTLEGDHFPYDKNPTTYATHMGKIAKAVKTAYPNIKIAVIKQKMEAGNQADWNKKIDDAFKSTTDTNLNTYVDAVTNHWYQNGAWYVDQDGDTESTANSLTDAKTALGFAYDYISFKNKNDVLGTPTGKELWITEGDILDTSIDDSWLRGLRDAIIQINYSLMTNLTMHTPQIFQPNYVNFDDLKLTSKGKTSTMIYSAAKGKTKVSNVNLGGAVFYGAYGGPYKDLQAVKYTNDSSSEQSYIIINASNNAYNDMDLSDMISQTGLKSLQRGNSTNSWTSDTFTETVNKSLDYTEVSFPAFSITLIAEEAAIDNLVEDKVIVCDLSSTYPKRYIKLYDFGTDLAMTSSISKTLHIKNNSSSSINLASTDPISLESTTNFSITTQPTVTALAAGATTSFTVRFNPTELGDLTTKIKVTLVNDRNASNNSIITTTNLIANTKLSFNGDFEQGISTNWTFAKDTDVTSTYENAATSDLYNGSNSAKINTTVLDSSPSYEHVTLTSDYVEIPSTLSRLKLQYFAKATSSTNSEYEIKINFFNSDKTSLSSSTTATPKVLTTSYAEDNYEVDVPTNTKYVKISLRCGKKINTLYFDDFEILKGTSSTDRINISENNTVLISKSVREVDANKPYLVEVYDLTGQHILTHKTTNNKFKLPDNLKRYVVYILIISAEGEETISKKIVLK